MTLTSHRAESAQLIAERSCHLTLAVHVCIKVQLSDVVRLGWLDPHALPDAAAGCVKYVGLAQCLFANRNHIVAAVCRVVHKDEPIDCPYTLVAEGYTQELEKCVQLVLLVEGQIIGRINREVRVASSIEGSFVAINKDRSLIVDGSKVE